MTFPTAKTPMGRRLAISALAFAIVAGIGGAIWLTSTPAPASASMSQTSSSLGSDSAKPAPATAADRAKFRADLKAARALTGQARIDAIKKVRTDAKAGKYGPRIEKRVEHARARIWGHAPAALKADLKAARAADPADRPAKLHAIFVKAEAGDYGDQVKKHADKLKAIVDGS
jgi:hypothetical protein